MTPRRHLSNEEFEALSPAERQAWIDGIVAAWTATDARKMDAEHAADRRDEADNDWTR